MSFSDGGGATLALPSPTHAHQIDVTSAVRTLRRSISRSPSKFLSRTSSQSSEGSQQTSPKSPCRRFGVTPQHQHRFHHQHYPQSAPPTALSMQTLAKPSSPSLATPLRPNVKLSLRSAKTAKTTTPSRPPLRQRPSPKSPLKRMLNINNDIAKTSELFTPSASNPEIGQENCYFGQRSPSTRGSLSSRPSRHSCHLDVSGTSHDALLKALDASPSTTPSGALKRSDATMNLDYPAQGSPSAKRRSLHGISGSDSIGDLSIFNTAVEQGFNIHEDSGSDLESNGVANFAFRDSSSPGTPGPPKRTSLRKSTLQQRYGEKTSLSRRSGERHLAQMSPEPSSPARSRPRLSSDQFVPPFKESTTPLGSPISTSLIQVNDSKSHQPHPLSRILTNSSSGNSLEGDLSLNAPVKTLAEKPKARPFSQSLPLNATRPTARPWNEHINVATPGQSQLWAGAFHSTGLISKVNRNPEDEADSKIAPPDTPCKKHTNIFATYPFPPNSALKKKPPGNNRNSFAGVPSTPHTAAVSGTPGTFGNPEKGLSIFYRGAAARNARRGSLLSLEDESKADTGGDISDLLTPDAPPTPTKATLTPSLSNVSECSLESPSANRTISFPMPISAVRPEASRESTCKSNPGPGTLLRSSFGTRETASSVERVARSTEGLPGHQISFPSMNRSRTSRGMHAPAPLQAPQAQSMPLKLSRRSTAKTVLNTAASIDGRRTPGTPQEALMPLDTSRLGMPSFGDFADNTAPPVTPTTARDFRSSTASIFVTPVNGRTSNVDLDPSLTQRFDKVEQIGKGEFSTVYRVTKLNQSTGFSLFSTTPQASPGKNQIFAVKKSRHPFHGNRDRESKLQEVRILQALKDAEHVVHYVDHWEHNLHLFIQTEFCEEGNLEKFLGNVGRSARLDDFRIFKILEDLCLGLKEIHDAGFMHLDMKPANILISFEGALKIGDFGLAQPCSSTEVTEEGDREYMAPEVLRRGVVDRSADVFSLGLMILEAAANVILPDNGPTWMALRSGDLSDVPGLTWNPSSDVQRDATGNPTASSHSDGLQNDYFHDGGNLFGSFKRSTHSQPPEFMVDATHVSSLDRVVRWMTAEEPEDRPTVEQVLDLEGLRWVAEHRNAPATVYEGNWGPADPLPVLIAADGDTEMTDA